MQYAINYGDYQESELNLRLNNKTIFYITRKMIDSSLFLIYQHDYHDVSILSWAIQDATPGE